MKARARYALAGVVLCGCGGAASSDHLDHGRIAAASSSIIGGVDSTTADDFVVFVTSSSRVGGNGAQLSMGCGGTLVAPNLVLTAKHCVNEYDQTSNSLCDASGEPQLGSTGGFITKRLPESDARIHVGIDARKQATDGAAPAAMGAMVIDDGTPTLCSHDLAYVVLDHPVTSVPVAKLRLGARPSEGPNSTIALAGWGEVEHRASTGFRRRRGGIHIQRVGPPAPIFGATGSLGPRTFETGPGGAKGDSGGPAMDETTGAVLGVLARALNTDPKDPISPYGGDLVVDVFMTVTDFDGPLRAAFAAAAAEPWLEDRDGPGYVRFGEACRSNLECAGNLCDGVTTDAPGVCNVDCAVADAACPSGFTCAGRHCVVEPSSGDAGSFAATADAETTRFGLGGGCAMVISSQFSPGGLVALTACALLTRRIRMRPRKRR